MAAVLASADWQADGFAVNIPPSWHQGRTAYGGFSASLAYEAVRRIGETASGDGQDRILPPLRSVQVSFVGPLAGRVSVSARRLRAGRNAVWFVADITAEGASSPGLVANFVFMRGIDGALALGDALPPAGFVAPEEAPIMVWDKAPVVLQHHIEARSAQPRGAGQNPGMLADMAWWLRLREHEDLDPTLALLLIADAQPPAVMALLPPSTMVSSMMWQANLLDPKASTRDGWWLLGASADHARDGCSSQSMRVRNADGRMVLAGTQSVAYFG